MRSTSRSIDQSAARDELAGSAAQVAVTGVVTGIAVLALMPYVLMGVGALYLIRKMR